MKHSNNTITKIRSTKKINANYPRLTTWDETEVLLIKPVEDRVCTLCLESERNPLLLLECRQCALFVHEKCFTIGLNELILTSPSQEEINKAFACPACKVQNYLQKLGKKF
jgi:hypothetical protein